MRGSFLHGISDSSEGRLGVFLLFKSPKLRRKASQTVLLNGVLFIGSIQLYKYLVEPNFRHVYAELGVDSESQEGLCWYMYTMYVATWILPMYMLSFVLNTSWYEEIATETHRLLVGGVQASRRPSAPGRTTAGVPVTLRIADVLYRGIFNVVFILQSNLVYKVPYFGFILYILHLAFLFSLTAFEYRLTTAEGWTSERRLAFIQMRWTYFAGFGLLPAVFASLFPQFIEAGVLALLLPVGIVAAAVSDPDNTAVSLFPVFMPSLWVTGILVKLIDFFRT